MKRTTTALLGGAALLASSLPASATGGLDCDIKDANLNFSFSALFNRGSSQFLDASTSFEALVPGVHPRQVKMDGETLPLTQKWYEGDELKLQFYTELQNEEVDFASVKLTIQTKIDDDSGDHVGTYALVAHGEDLVEVTGEARCIAG
jgi:hypothetical protein